jgi:hypothetical protein
MKPFTIVTDHIALKWLKTSKMPKGRCARWIMELQQYDFNIKHRPGKLNANADALSRMNEQEEINERFYASCEFVSEIDNVSQTEDALALSRCCQCDEDRPFVGEYNNGWETLPLCQDCVVDMFGEGSNRNANKTPEKCERCEQVKYCKTEWNIFRGFNSYCSIIGGKCNIYDGHHTHQVCNTCAYKLNGRNRCNTERLQAQKEEDERCINRAKEYIWEKCDCRIENGVIMRNRQMMIDLKLKDKERLNTKITINIVDTC